MKGLLTKDFSMAVNTCWTYMLIIITFLVISVVSDNSFFLAYPLIFVSVIPLNLLTLDEKCHWQNYANCMPYSRKEIVASKYISGAVMTGSIVVLLLAVQAVKLILKSGLTAAVFREIAALFTLFLIMGSIVSNITLPFMFKFGSEKSRIILCLICGFAGGIMGMLTSMTSRYTLSKLINAIAGTPTPLIVCAGILFALAAWIASFAISVHTYQRRDL